VAPEPPVRPRPLGLPAAETLVRERMPQASAAFASACHAVTAGNPFLLQALLGQLAADGAVPGDETARRLGAFGPEQVARTVGRQLARLPDGAGALAHAVAVLGRGRRCGTPPPWPASASPARPGSPIRCGQRRCWSKART